MKHVGYYGETIDRRKMNRRIFIVLGMAFTVLLFTGCASYRNQRFPRFLSYKYKDNELYKENRVMILEVGDLLPEDTISVMLNGKLLIPNVTTSTPYPEYICPPKYGGHYEHDFWYLLVKSRNGKSLRVYNYEDPKKKSLGKVKTNNRLVIDATYKGKSGTKSGTMELCLDTIPFAHILIKERREFVWIRCTVGEILGRG